MSATEREQIEREKWLKEARIWWINTGAYGPRLGIVGLNLAAVWWLPSEWAMYALLALYWPNLIWAVSAHGALGMIIGLAPGVIGSIEGWGTATRSDPWGAMLYVWIVTVVLLLPPAWLVDEDWAWRIRKRVM